MVALRREDAGAVRAVHWRMSSTSAKGTTMSTYATSPDTSSTTPALLGAASALVAMALSTIGAHNWTEAVVEIALVAVTAGLVFGVVVPRALRKDSAGGTALALAIPAVLLVVPAFWTGLPMVLGVAALVVGSAGRSARHGAGRCIAAIVLGGLAVLAYLAVNAADFASGARGFLLD